MSTAIASCPICGGTDLPAIYRPFNGQRGLTVHLCTGCGLVQSLPRIDHVDNRVRAVSSGGDWGNVRYGKGFRTDASFALMKRVGALEGLQKVLDIGANRGAFCLELHRQVPSAAITALEPDATVVDALRDQPGITLQLARIEKVDFPARNFELIYSCHTFEHLADPVAQLRRVADWLAPSGLAYIEVPNIDALKDPDLIEEWFLDKHLFHFSPHSFLAALAVAGLEPVEGGLDINDDKIAVIARRGSYAPPADLRHDAAHWRRLVKAYEESFAANRVRAAAVVRAIRGFAPQRVAFWGGGRIFHSLAQHGGLKSNDIVGLVDRELWKYVKDMLGFPITKPEDVGGLRPDIIVIASRSFFDEIKAEAAKALPDCRLISFTELLAEGGGQAPLRRRA